MKQLITLLILVSSATAHGQPLTKYQRLERRLAHIEALLAQQLSDAKAHQSQVEAHNKAGDACRDKYGPWSENEPKDYSEARRQCFESVPNVSSEPRYEY